MTEDDQILSEDSGSSQPRSLLRIWLGVSAAGLGLALGLVWAEREYVAQRLIDHQLAQLKLAAHYRIDEVGVGREVLADIAIGDPAHPDFFAKRLQIDTGWNGLFPGVTGITVESARLHATLRKGQVSFGSLDRSILQPSRTPFRLPDITLTLRDARVSIGGDVGPIGLAVTGGGGLRGGFAATAAMAAPMLAGRGCAVRAANLNGTLTIIHEAPHIVGPLQGALLSCPGARIAVTRPRVQMDVRIDSTLKSGAAHWVLSSQTAQIGAQSAARLTGSGDAGLQNGTLAANFALNADKVSGPQGSAQTLGVTAYLRTLRDGQVMQGDGAFSGSGLTPDAGVISTLSHAERTSGGTLAAPLLAALHSSITREASASRLNGSWILRASSAGTSLTVPEAHLDGGQTAHWLSLSHLSATQAAGAGGVAVTGDFAAVGAGLPELHGRIRPLAGGGGVAAFSMPRWTAHGTSLAVPNLALSWSGKGPLAMRGQAMLTGPVPGGTVTDLSVPIEGIWSAGKGLAIGSRCTDFSFERVEAASVVLGGTGPARQALTLCPSAAGQAMLTLGAHGPQVAVRARGLNFDGRMNGAPMRVASGALSLAWPGSQARPGALNVWDVGITLAGGGAATSRIALASLTANFGAGVTGQFAGGEGSTGGAAAAVTSASGDFRWANGRLIVDQTHFRIQDTSQDHRFAAMDAKDARLTYADGRIAATASLRASAVDRELAQVSVTHDLASNRGQVDVDMPGLVFDKALQPKQLSPLVEGEIADAKGTLQGHARIDWSGGHITSSGRISTKGFDLAAPFGPVQGIAGEVVFTDLLGLVTAPDQQLTIAAINPGIEVDDGRLTFALQPGHVLMVKGAEWPFLDGKLSLLPTRMVLGASEVRYYELKVDGLNAAKFLARMDMSNLAATGTFDGNLPLVFDPGGGRIEKGVLISRPPGGTVSYVGALSYKDLSPMANYAFQALRAMKYRQMRIGMDGPLAGNIMTRVVMQGVGQGQGAKHNFITNQFARLPIQFNINVTAPFMQLVTSFRSLYDPALVADPRELGLIDAHGKRIAHPAPENLPAASAPANPPPSVIQH